MFKRGEKKQTMLSLLVNGTDVSVNGKNTITS